MNNMKFGGHITEAQVREFLAEIKQVSENFSALNSVAFFRSCCGQLLFIFLIYTIIGIFFICCWISSMNNSVRTYEKQIISII